jgi:hypothetical protein
MDKRSPFQKVLDAKIGPPLYYCSDCRLAVEVTGEPPEIHRPCEGCAAQVIAPRSAVCVGQGGASTATKVAIKWAQLKAALTGRCA